MVTVRLNNSYYKYNKEVMLHCAFLPLESNSNKSIFVWAGECLESHLWAGSVVVGWQCGSETLKGASYICLRRRLSGVTPLRWSRSRRMTMRLGDPDSDSDSHILASAWDCLKSYLWGGSVAVGYQCAPWSGAAPQDGNAARQPWKRLLLIYLPQQEGVWPSASP